jgi:hypothetical protein
MIYLAIGSVILSLVLGFTTFNLMRKIEKYEDWSTSQQSYLEEVSSVITFIDERIQELDKKQSFSSDDEVGFFFERIKLLNDLLKRYELDYGKKDPKEKVIK